MSQREDVRRTLIAALTHELNPDVTIENLFDAGELLRVFPKTPTLLTRLGAEKDLARAMARFDAATDRLIALQTAHRSMQEVDPVELAAALTEHAQADVHRINVSARWMTFTAEAFRSDIKKELTK